MNKQEIQEKYWIDFLIWYRGASLDDTYVYNGHSFLLIPIEDLFWDWLVKIRAKDSGRDFIEDLKAKDSSNGTRTE